MRDKNQWASLIGLYENKDEMRKVMRRLQKIDSNVEHHVNTGKHIRVTYGHPDHYFYYDEIDKEYDNYVRARV